MEAWAEDLQGCPIWRENSEEEIGSVWNGWNEPRFFEKCARQVVGSCDLLAEESEEALSQIGASEAGV